MTPQKKYAVMLVLALFSAYDLFARQSCYTNRNTVLFRPFSSYSFHDIVGSEYELNPTHHTQDHRMTLTVTPEYMQNFGNKCCKKNGYNSFGAYPFWSGTNELTIGKNDGRVKAINSSGVDVVEQFKDDSGRVRKENIRITLPRKQ